MGPLIKNGVIYSGNYTNYSHEPIFIGKFLNDGKIYRKVVEITTGIAKDNTIKVCDIPSDMKMLLKAYGVIETTEGSFSNNDILVYSNANENSFYVKQNFTSYPKKLTIIIEYIV